MPLPGFTESLRSHDGATRTVYRRGAGPGVLIMHELPGITPPVAAFAARVADAGFTVFMPHLFGTTGKPATPLYVATEMARACVSREFRVLAANQSSPIVDEMRAICREIHAELGGRVGAIGMCITGNFALALMVDPFVAAPVLSQPTLPLGITRRHRAALHVSDADLAVVKRRAEDGTHVLGLRFTQDRLCPAEKFARLRAELAGGFEGIEIDSRPGNPHGIKPSAHSVLTEDLIDEAGHPTRQALDRVLEFLHAALDSNDAAASKRA